jgi:LIX1-like protein
MDNQSVNEAIEILIANFTRHPSLTSRLSNTNDVSVDILDLLQEFWSRKSIETSEMIKYEFLEKPDPPFVCFVTLPGGSCFATFQNVLTKLEAKKSAATISLMNSIFNEHPLRRITDEFISKSIEDAQRELVN